MHAHNDPETALGQLGVYTAVCAISRQRPLNVRMHIAVCARANSKQEVMFSYEDKRASAYSADLRWRMSWQREVLGMTNRDIAANLGVDSEVVFEVV